MYKRFTLNELKTVQNNFISNFYWIVKKENCVTTSDFFKKIFKDWNDIYYFNRWEWLFKCSKQDKDLVLSDEREKIQIVMDEQEIKEFQWIIKNFILKKSKKNWQKSIEEILLDEFYTGKYSTILGKKYLVYDIETTSGTANLKELKFLIAYSMEPNDNNKMTYEYIDQDNLKEFVQKLIDFDGYIIWFNSIAFDNIVSVYNAGLAEEYIEKINDKTIDIFLFIRAMTGKRISLNKIGEALVGISKTLESWMEWEKLYNKYIETWDEKSLEEFKQYCKNDVRMTTLILLYLMHFKKIYIEWEEIFFTIKDLVEKSQKQIKERIENMKWQSIFE